MTYGFTSRRAVSDTVRRIAGEQVEKAMDRASPAGDFNDAVHELRKSCKKIRALLRLVRDGMPAFEQENGSFRAIAADLSTSRDATIMVETFTGVFSPKDQSFPENIQSEIEEVRSRLVSRAAHVRDQTDQSVLLAAAKQQLQDAKERIARWEFSAKGEDLVLPGLERCYRALRKRFGAIDAKPHVDAVHELRKAAKMHWYHVRLWQLTAPDLLRPRAQLLDRIGDALGDHHNLAVLRDWLDATTLGHDAVRAAMFGAVETRQAELLAVARPMLSQITVEKPKALAKRFAACWSLMDGDDG